MQTIEGGLKYWTCTLIVCYVKLCCECPEFLVHVGCRYLIPCILYYLQRPPKYPQKDTILCMSFYLIKCSLIILMIYIYVYRSPRSDQLLEILEMRLKSGK